MTYHELVEKVKAAFTSVDAANLEHIAVQVNVTGEEAGGAFYIEAADGRLAVEPWEYFDRDAQVTLSAEDILTIAEGKQTLEAAIADGTVALDGNYDKVKALSAAIAASVKPKKRAARKTSEKKATKAEAAAVTETAPKRRCGRPRKTEETPKKTTTRKTSAKKTTSKKTEA
jgi:hypothetical protein